MLSEDNNQFSCIQSRKITNYLSLMRSEATQPACDVFISAQQVSMLNLYFNTGLFCTGDDHNRPTTQPACDVFISAQQVSMLNLYFNTGLFCTGDDHNRPTHPHLEQKGLRHTWSQLTHPRFGMPGHSVDYWVLVMYPECR
jgi:hypothetical protein